MTLWLAGKAGEAEAVKQWSGSMLTVPAEGLAGGFGWRKFRSMLRLLRAGRRCHRLMRESAPDGVLAMGSYASYGPLYAATRLRLPMVVHEANVVPGKAVSLFCRWASSVAASFEETRFYMKRRNIAVTGMPLRRGLSPSEAAVQDLGLDPRVFTLLIMGGSRGARFINQTVPYAVCNLSDKGYRIQVMHLAGVDDAAWVKDLYRDHGINAWVEPFTHHMGSLYLQANLVISRAGASSCAEVRAFRLPSLLLPYPHAVKDHQTANARAMEKSGGADWVAQKDFSIEWLEEYLSGNMDFPERLERMRRALDSEGEAYASEMLANLVELTIRRQQKRQGAGAV